MKWKTSKRWMALILSLLMVLSAIPLDVFGSAEEAADVETIPEEITEEAVEEPVEAPAEEPAAVPSAEEETVIPAEDTAIVDSDESSYSASAEEPQTLKNVEETEEPVTGQTNYTFENDTMTVQLQLAQEDALPEGTQLQVTPIDDYVIDENTSEEVKTLKAKYDDIVNLLKDVKDADGNPVDGFFAYHAELISDGEVYQPQGEVNMLMTYKEAALPDTLKGESRLRTVNVKMFQYTTAQDEAGNMITVLDDREEHLTAFNFADDAIGSVSEYGFNAYNLSDFVIAWTGQDQTTEFTCMDDNQEVTVTATLSQPGILPRGAELKATKVADADELATVESMMADQTEADKELAGFVTYDIRFEKDGVEVEPTGEVNVSLQFNETAKPETTDGEVTELPDDASADDIEVYHLKESADTNEIEVQKLDNAVVETVGNAEVSKTEFATDSFSYFVIKWSSNTKYVYCVDEEGNTIGENISLGSLSVTNDSDDGTNISSLANEIDGYTFLRAYKASSASSSSKSEVVKLYYKSSGKNKGFYYKTGNYSSWTRFGSNDNLYFEYRAEGAVKEYCSEEIIKLSESSQRVQIFGSKDDVNSGGTEIRFYVFVDDTNKGYYTRRFQDSDVAFYVNPSAGYSLESIQLNSKKDLSGVGRGTYANQNPNDTINLSDVRGIQINLKSKEANVSKIDTVDGRADGISMGLYNYSSAINSPSVAADGFYFHNNVGGVDGPNNAGTATYTHTSNQRVHQEYLKNNLSENGYPLLTSGDSLEYLFESGTAVTAYNGLSGLFQKDENGYYYYDSSNHHAQLNQENNWLDVYNARLSPLQSSFNYGNFLPFNNLPATARDNTLSSVDGGRAATDYWFGMNIGMNFYQPKNGEINGEDMVFDFRGDDDVWVFIDGIKVLDLGGIHDKKEGSINFKTGVVKAEGIDDTTIAARYEAAYREANPRANQAKVTEYLDGIFNKDRDGSYTSFKNFSSHSMEFFYLERGGGAANCKISFNMRPLPTDSVTVSKEISNYDDGAYSDVEFAFKLYAETEAGNGNFEAVMPGTEYTLRKADDTTEIKTVDSDGTFKLRHGEQAQFSGMTQGQKYYVEEVGLSSEAYDEVVIESAGIVNQDGDSVVGEDQTTIRSEELTIGTDTIVNFKNRCAATNMKHLLIQKTVAGGATDDTYTMRVTLGGELYRGTYKVGATYDAALAGESLTTNNGRISLKSGQIAVIIGNAAVSAGGETTRGIPSGTSFKVEEINLDPDNYLAPEFTVVDSASYTADSISSQNGYDGYASGVININKNAKAVVTNKTSSVDLSFVKTDSGDNILPGAVFTLTNSSNTVIGTETSDTDGMVTFSGVSTGTYTLTETQSPDGYVTPSSVWTVTIAVEDNGTGSVYMEDAEGNEVGKLDVSGEKYYRIHNFTEDEYLEKNLDYDKQVELLDWNERTYGITLSATSKITEQVKATPYDIVLVLDASGSMDNNFYTFKPYSGSGTPTSGSYYVKTTSGIYQQASRDNNRNQYYYYDTASEQNIYVTNAQLYSRSYGGDKKNDALENAATLFLDMVRESSPDSRMGVVYFAGSATTKRSGGNELLRVGNDSSYTTLNSWVNNVPKSGATNASAGMGNAKAIYDGTKNRETVDQVEGRKNLVIFLTDGVPTTGNTFNNDVASGAVANARAIKTTHNATIYSLGIFDSANTSGQISSGSIKQIDDYMTGVASSSDYYMTADSVESLENLFESIGSSLGKTITADIVDTIDKRFELAEGEEARLTAAGVTVTHNADGSTTLTWPDAAIQAAKGEEPGWKSGETPIVIRAKDEYIGGNSVTTNGSDSRIDSEIGTVYFEQPTVNVKAELKINNAETTIFLGDTVPTDEAILKRLFDSGYTIGRDGGELKASDFVKEWYKDEACSQPVTLEDLARIAPTDTQKFYLKVTYDAGAPTEESTGRTDGNIAGGDDHIVTAVNSDTKNYKDKEYGVYTVYVVDGQLTITKKIDEQYTHIKPINANQSFVFKIQKYAVNADGSRGDLVNTFYEVINFNANESDTEKTKTISGLSKGYYTVTEETEWSAKYDLVSQADNFEENTDECADLYIGKKLESSNDKLSFYGVGNTEENVKHANVLVASTEFTNNIDREWKWLSDTAAAVNKFNQ
ncbi:SpaA isopeptide-forming pilin-related protein [Ruminococcus gauvreauii]|uniref:SpaA isopeptide-forming pilin-related protein n=1 Tax=Ruminococcus gauvreauii TaxID=438033 RepID=UPI0039844030